MYREKPLSAGRHTVFTFALTLLNHGKRFLTGKVFFFLFSFSFFPISCTITQVAFPVSSLPSGPGSCNYYCRDLEGRLLSPPRPPPTLFSFWPRLRRAALT